MIEKWFASSEPVGEVAQGTRIRGDGWAITWIVLNTNDVTEAKLDSYIEKSMGNAGTTKLKGK